MLLSSLLQDSEILNEYEDVDVLTVTAQTNEVVADSVFVCISGENFDGHNFIKKAFFDGAVAIIAEETSKVYKNKNIVLVKNTRKCYALMCKRLYKSYCDDMKLIATTGTNGKTSVTTIMQAILTTAKIKTAMITTINAQYGDFFEPLERTTPDAKVLHKLFLKMYDAKCEAVCLEASSQALDQSRLEGCNFDVAIFTNLTQDHLDYHKTVLAYFEAKRKLFDMAKFAVINLDDEYGKKIIADLKIPYYTYSIKDKTADFFADEIFVSANGVEFLLKYNNIEAKISFKIPGIYSVMNVLAATATAVHMGISVETIITALMLFDGICGRCEVLSNGLPFHVFCDYAHTPDGLLNILKSVKSFCRGRLIVLFGAGGNRDKQKRPLMGKVAAEYADFLVITSDNPRAENPKKIMGDIIKGIPLDKEFIAIVDRTCAIKYALSIAKPDDTVLLAGKGHEKYSILGDKKIYYDERKIVEGYKKLIR